MLQQGAGEREFAGRCHGRSGSTHLKPSYATVQPRARELGQEGKPRFSTAGNRQPLHHVDAIVGEVLEVWVTDEHLRRGLVALSTAGRMGADFVAHVDDALRRHPLGLAERRAAVDVRVVMPLHPLVPATKSLQRLLVRTDAIKPRESLRSVVRLSLVEREEISRGLPAGDSMGAIGRCTKRSTSTISRKVAPGGGRVRCRAWKAERNALHQACRLKLTKLLRFPRLRREVERRLVQRWAPQQIAERLRVDFPDDAGIRVSHETICRALFVQSWGALRRELSPCLRSVRAKRRPRGRKACIGAGKSRTCCC